MSSVSALPRAARVPRRAPRLLHAFGVGLLFLLTGPAALAAVSPLDRVQTDQRIQALVEQHRPALREQAVERSTPEARARRAESRTRYRSMAPADALSLARGRFDRQVLPEAGPLLKLSPDARVSGYLDDRTAVVHEDESGQTVASLARSLLPLRRDNGSGIKSPVDFTLTARGNGFSPRNPLVETSIPGRLADGFRIGEITLRPLVRGDEGVGARWQDAVFYGNVDADTDALLKPIPTGTELFHQLRSPAAPEQLRVDLDLPAGVRAEQQEGAINLVRDGKRVGRIGAVWAVDASGAPVEASMSLEAGRLLIAVSHRSADVEYPILVDPAIEYYSHWGANNGDYNGWAWWPTHGAMRQYFFYGIHHVGPASTTWLDAYHKSEWYYPAPTGARIYKAQWQFASNQSPNGNECHMLGFMSSSGYWSPGSPGSWCYAHGVTGVWEQCAASTCTGGGSDGNRALWLSVMNGGANRNGSSYDSNLANATIFLQDTTIPTISPNRAGGQTIEEPAGSIAFDTRDDGVGLKKVVFSRLATATSAEVELWREEYSCAGIWRNRCPNHDPTDIDLDGSNVPFGTSTIRVQAWDYLDNYARYDWTITKVRDTTGPTIIPSGDLWDNRSTLIDRYAKLDVRATDTGTGTRDIKIFVNGYEQPLSAARSSACARCDLSLSWTLDYGDVDLAEDNTLEIRSTDMNGNPSSTSWPMLLESPDDPVDPTLSAEISDTDSAAPVGTQAEGCSDPENYIPGEESCPLVVDDAPSGTITAEPRAAGTALGAGGTGWGVADEKPEVFSMEGTKQLRPRIVRKILPWDVLRRTTIPAATPATYYCRPKLDGAPGRPVSVGRDTATFDEWEQWLKNAKAMADAQGRTIEVIVSFARTREKAAYCYLPTTKQYREAVSEFIAKYKDGSSTMPPVKNYSAWNEPNHAGQPTSWKRNRKAWSGRLKGPAQAGRYWVALNSACVSLGCKAAAAEFTDGDASLFKKTRRYPAFWPEYLKGLAGKNPVYWAFHPYWTGQEVGLSKPPRTTTETDRVFARLDAFIRRVRARNSSSEIWFTEQGARWHRLSPELKGHTDFNGQTDTYTDGRANNVMNALITEVVGRNSRIKVFTVYQMVSHASEGWDSGLLKYTGDPAWQLWSPRTMWSTYKAKAAP